LIKNYLTIPLTKEEKEQCYCCWYKSKPTVIQGHCINDTKHRTCTVSCVFYSCFHLLSISCRL